MANTLYCLFHWYAKLFLSFLVSNCFHFSRTQFPAGNVPLWSLGGAACGKNKTNQHNFHIFRPTMNAFLCNVLEALIQNKTASKSWYINGASEKHSWWHDMTMSTPQWPSHLAKLEYRRLHHLSWLNGVTICWNVMLWYGSVTNRWPPQQPPVAWFSI